MSKILETAHEMARELHAVGAMNDVTMRRMDVLCLEALLLDGLASKSIPLDEDFWTGLRAKSARIVERHTARKKTP